MSDDRTAVTIGSLRLRNPFLAASGTFGYGTEYRDVVDLSRLGGIVTKSLTVRPREGNPTPRICETPGGMINAIGLENCGLDVFVERKLPALAAADTAVLVSVAGESVEDYRRLVERLATEDAVDAFEINVSCPNVKEGTMFGADGRQAARLMKALRPITTKPLVPKLTPTAVDLVEVARACVAEGADAVALINTLPGMVVDVRTRRPMLANVTGGLSGPAIRPVAVRMVHQVHQALPKTPLIGIGGIACIADAAQFLIVGATAVEIGTALFADPDLLNRLAGELRAYLDEQGLGSVRQLIGTLRPKAESEKECPRPRT